jgi:hypothetical protein
MRAAAAVCQMHYDGLVKKRFVDLSAKHVGVKLDLSHCLAILIVDRDFRHAVVPPFPGTD